MSESSSSSLSSSAPLRDLRGETPLHLFLRFLRFGLLAWGGPVAQIDLIRHELVDREKWISPERFNRVLGVYQALPGPEATELCCYFGMLARGRLGAILAGLGFILPGFILMLLASILYLHHGLTSPLVLAAFTGMQPAVAALMIRAVHRIGARAVSDGTLAFIAILATLAQAMNVHFAITLGASALLGLARTSKPIFAVIAAIWLCFLVAFPAVTGPSKVPEIIASAPAPSPPSTTQLATLGLKAGLLTFGGAYTAVPIVEREAIARPAIDDGDAVKPARGWMTQHQLLDGLAISGILPAPFIIFTTFIGYLGGGTLGALLITACVFLPAFAFTLVGHTHLERLVDNKDTHNTLDAITAGVVGIIAVTAARITIQAIDLTTAPAVNPAALAIFFTALIALYTIKWRYLTPVLIASTALCGAAFLQ